MLSGAIGRLVVQIGADIADFKAKMSEVKEESDATAQALRDNYKAIGIAMAAMGAAITGFGMLSVKNFMDVGDQLDKMSKRTGVAVEFLSQLRYVADRSGTSLEGFETGMRRLQRAINDAGQGMLEYQRAFTQLGLNYEDLARKSPEEQFMAVMRALAGVSDASKRAALAQELLGRSGTMLIPMISDGVGAFEDLMNVASDLGITMDKETAAKAAKLKDTMTSLKMSTQGLMREVGEGLAPMLKGVADIVTKLTSAFSKWADANPVLANTISQVVMGIGALLVVGGALLILLPLITAKLALLGVTLHLLLGPVGWVILAVTALAAAFLYLSNRASEASRKRLEAEKAALEEKKRLLAEELKVVQETYDDEVEAINKATDAKLKAIDDEQAIAERYYDWKLSQLEATRDAALDALDSEKAIAERYYDWQMSKIAEARDAAIEAVRDQLEAAQKAYDLQRKAVEEQTNAEIESIGRVRDERLAALQEQLDAMDRLELADRRGQIEARKKEIEALLEVAKTEETRQSLLEEYASLNSDLTDLDRQEKRSAIQEEMDNIRVAAEADIKASQDRMAAAIAGLDATLQTAIGNAATATDQANADYEAAQLNLETLISTSLTGTAEETALITAKWAEEMKGQLDFQTQWQLDYDARVEAIQTEYADAKTALEDLIKTGTTGTAEEIAAITEKWDAEMTGNLDFQTQWQLDHQARLDGIEAERDAAIEAALALMAASEEAAKLKYYMMYEEPIGPGLTDVGGPTYTMPPNLSWWDKVNLILKKISIPGYGMAEGGQGTVYEPTLFLAGEAGRESFAFGKYAESRPVSSSISNGLEVHIHAGIFMGSQAEAQKLGEILNPIIRRQMRANTGEALW